MVIRQLVETAAVVVVVALEGIVAVPVQYFYLEYDLTLLLDFVEAVAPIADIQDVVDIVDGRHEVHQVEQHDYALAYIDQDY